MSFPGISERRLEALGLLRKTGVAQGEGRAVAAYTDLRASVSIRGLLAKLEPNTHDAGLGLESDPKREKEASGSCRSTTPSDPSRHSSRFTAQARANLGQDIFTALNTAYSPRTFSTLPRDVEWETPGRGHPHPCRGWRWGSSRKPSWWWKRGPRCLHKQNRNGTDSDNTSPSRDCPDWPASGRRSRRRGSRVNFVAIRRRAGGLGTSARSVLSSAGMRRCRACRDPWPASPGAGRGRDHRPGEHGDVQMLGVYLRSRTSIRMPRLRTTPPPQHLGPALQGGVEENTSHTTVYSGLSGCSATPRRPMPLPGPYRNLVSVGTSRRPTPSRARDPNNEVRCTHAVTVGKVATSRSSTSSPGASPHDDAQRLIVEGS